MSTRIVGFRRRGSRKKVERKETDRSTVGRGVTGVDPSPFKLRDPGTNSLTLTQARKRQTGSAPSPPLHHPRSPAPESIRSADVLLTRETSTVPPALRTGEDERAGEAGWSGEGGKEGGAGEGRQGRGSRADGSEIGGRAAETEGERCLTGPHSSTKARRPVWPVYLHACRVVGSGG